MIKSLLAPILLSYMLPVIFCIAVYGNIKVVV